MGDGVPRPCVAVIGSSRSFMNSADCSSLFLSAFLVPENYCEISGLPSCSCRRKRKDLCFTYRSRQSDLFRGEESVMGGGSELLEATVMARQGVPSRL